MYDQLTDGILLVMTATLLDSLSIPFNVNDMLASYVFPEDSSPSSTMAYFPGDYGATITVFRLPPDRPHETVASPS